MSNNQRPRAVFAPEDYAFLRKAILHYLNTADADTEEQRCLTRIIHRLGRFEDVKY